MKELCRLVLSLAPVRSSSSSVPSVPGAGGAPASPRSSWGWDPSQGLQLEQGWHCPCHPLSPQGGNLPRGETVPTWGPPLRLPYPSQGTRTGLWVPAATFHLAFSFPISSPPLTWDKGLLQPPRHVSDGLSTLQTALARLPPVVTALSMAAGFLVSARQREELPAWLEQEQGGNSTKLPTKCTGNHESKYFEPNTQLAGGTHHHKMPLRPRVLNKYVIKYTKDCPQRDWGHQGDRTQREQRLGPSESYQGHRTKGVTKLLCTSALPS